MTTRELLQWELKRKEKKRAQARKYYNKNKKDILNYRKEMLLRKKSMGVQPIPLKEINRRKNKMRKMGFTESEIRSMFALYRKGEI